MINSFKNYLVEEEKTLYFVWGRMNPPTAGHEKLLDFLKSKAGSNPFRVYLTHTEDNKKNPIPYVQKVKFARKGFPQYARQIMMDKKLKNLFDAVTSFYNEGFKRIVIVAGSDRIREYEILLNKYNGVKGKHGFYNFERISVLSAGDRDPESTGVEGVSGTKLRGYAESGDFTKFAQYMPKKLSNADAKAVYNAVRQGLGLKEQKEFKNHIQLESVSQLRESYVDGRLFEVGDTVVVKESGEVATVKHLGSNYVIVENTGTQYRKWLDAVERVDEPKVEYEIFESTLIEVSQDPHIKDKKGTQPAKYYAGIKSKSTKSARDAHFKRGAEKSDDDPSAYKPAPGDATVKTKPSKHTKRFKQMFGEQDAVDMAKKRIEREKEVYKKNHDRELDVARLKDTLKKNRETS
jgi:hypothetical protein